MRIAIVWLALSIILIAVSLPAILGGAFPDPDDTLRLVQVRDLLAGQSWWDLHQYRIDPPAGTLMHWSRLVDAPLALVIAFLTPVFGQNAAEASALVLVPLLTLGAVLFVIGRLATRLFDLNVATMVCLSLAFMAPLVVQLQPMRIDHHGWQVFTVALALLGAFDTRAWRGGLIAGGAMALGANISLETMPMAAVFGAAFALRWWRDHAMRWWLASYMAALACGLVAVFLLTRGLSDLAQHCDAISPTYLAFFAVTAAGTCALAATKRSSRIIVFGGMAVCGFAGLIVFGAASPDCLQTPFATLDPLVRDYWYVNVKEGRPVWEQDPDIALPILVQLLVALCVSFYWIIRRRTVILTDYTVILAGSLVLTTFVWRSSAFAAVIATVPLGWLLAKLRERITAGRMRMQIATVLAIVLLLLPSLPFTVVAATRPVLTPSAYSGVLSDHAGCDIVTNAALLQSLPRGKIFAPLDIGPSILVRTQHSVVATGHHRAARAMRDIVAGFTQPTSQARALITTQGADYVALCTDLDETLLYAERNPTGFAAELIHGKPPAWLTPLDIGGPAELLVYRVIRPN